MIAMVLFPIVFSFEFSISDVISNILTIVGFGLAYCQFTKQNKENRILQKDQNVKNWFISVIVMPQLNSINSMFDELVNKTYDSYKEVKKQDDIIKKASLQSECKEIVSSSLSHIQLMVASYDRDTSSSVSELIDQIQDFVTIRIGSSENLSKSDIRKDILLYKGILISTLFECSKK